MVKSRSSMVGFTPSSKVIELMCMLSPISRPSKLASRKAGILETNVFNSTSCLTMFKTPPCLIPGQLFSLENLTGT